MAQAGNDIITLSDIHAIRGDEPRIKDVRLGEALGMAQPLNIRKVIDKNRVELEGFGPIHAAREKVGIGSGAARMIEVYHLNEPQAVLICMFSRTEEAAKVRKAVIEVFMAYRGSAGKPVSVKAYSRALPTPKPQIDLAPGRYVIRVDDEGQVASTERLKRDVLLLDAEDWAEFYASLPRPRSFN